MSIIVIASSLSMLLSFALVQYLAKDASFDLQPAQDRIQQAGELRDASNWLLELTTEFLTKAASPSTDPGSEFERWRAYSFRPRLNDTRERLAASAAPEHLVAPLSEAAASLAALSVNHDQPDLRSRVARQVLDATAAAEAWIHENGLAHYLHQPATIPAFKR